MTTWSAPSEPEELPDLKGSRTTPQWPVLRDGALHHYHPEREEALLCAADLTLEDET